MPKFFRKSYRIYQTGEGQYGVFYRNWWSWRWKDAYPLRSRWFFTQEDAENHALYHAGRVIKDLGKLPP